MLKGNLSSRPFYNERLVSMVMIGAALLGVVLTIFNVTALSHLSGERSKQQAEEEQSLSEADRVRQSAQKLQQSLDASNLRTLGDQTREANWLIDQRTFSWTEFLGFIERTLPRDARLVAVAPRVERNVFKIVMLVNAKQQGDLETFIESLESTAAFKNVLPTDMTRLEDGTLSITLESTYVSDVLPSSKRSGKGVQAMKLVGRIFAERRAVVVPLALFLLANIGVLLGVVWPMQRAVNGADEARYQATKSLADARQFETEWKAKRNSKDRADLELRKFYSEILPTSFGTARAVANFFLQRVASESKLVLRSGQWEPEPLKDSHLMRVSGTVTLVGDYANIRRFLYEVETAQEFVVIERVELSEANSTQNDNRLELTLTVATYYVADRQATVVSR